jgi:nitrous oxidase accessory protein
MFKRILEIYLILIIALLGTEKNFSKELKVGSKFQFKNFNEAVNSSSDGDTIIVFGGNYLGNYVINKSLTLIGISNPIFDGNNNGTVITIEAPRTQFTGFTIKNSGILLDKEDAGILVKADNVTIKNNHLKGVLFGVYLRQSNGSVVKDNLIEGKKELDVPRRGDLFRGWYCKNILVEGNTFKYGRDVILWFSHNTEIIGNNISGARYGLHFMYNSNCKILKNTMTYNSVGMYMMYSRNLLIENNLLAYNRGPSGFGIGFKDLDNVELNKNLIADNRVGVFVDNSPREIDTFVKYSKNVIAYNETGIEELSTLEHSYFTGNSFIENYTQAQLSSAQTSDNDYWKGNYWSDYAGFDKDKNGIGDIPYKSEEFVENLIADNPNLKFFLYSPAINTLNYAAEAFPILQPQARLIDRSPITKPKFPGEIPIIKIYRETGFFILSLILSVFAAVFILIFIYKNKLTYSTSNKV